MIYRSTRDPKIGADPATAVTVGVPTGGGLFVPSSLPPLDYRSLTEMTYASRVDAVLKLFFDFDTAGITERAYAPFGDDPAPIVKLDERLFVLELWHGKTCSFKDMALSVMPELVAAAKKAKGDTRQTLILAATNGDTGKSAFENFKDVEGTQVCVFYPSDGMNETQKLALTSQSGDNVRAVKVKGNFDAVQAAVKRALCDAELVEKLDSCGMTLSSANSINIARLVPQIAYYYSAYCDLVSSGEISRGEKIDFVVPTGNFGNILAGCYARQMGLPINYLVCASNRNNALTDFIDTGCYDINRPLYKTSSCAMDVLIPNDLERLLYELSGHDAELVAKRMGELKETGRFTVSADEQDALRECFACGYADEDETDDAIAEMFDEYGYLIDPHTAVAYSVAREREFNRPTVVLSTVNPYKFAQAALKALGEPMGKTTSRTLEKLCDVSAMDIPQQLIDVFDAKVRFTETLDLGKTTVAEYIAHSYARSK